MAAVDTGKSVVNTGLGMLLQRHNNRVQLEQQGKLGEQQLGLNQRQMEYGKQLDYEMWKKTNYSAQMEEMEKAGLSTGLMYGGSGAGGATTGGSAGGVNAPSAPAGGGEIMGMQLLGAQKKLIEAQTAKTEAETVNTAGVERDLTGQKARMQRIEADLFANTYAENYSRIASEAAKAEEEWIKAAAEGKVAKATADIEIEKATVELIGLGLSNELKQKQGELTEAQIDATIEAVKQKWAEVRTGQGRLELEKFVRDISDSTKLAVETVSKVVSAVAGGRSIGRRINQPAERAPRNERGWSEKHGEWWKTID